MRLYLRTSHTGQLTWLGHYRSVNTYLSSENSFAPADKGETHMYPLEVCSRRSDSNLEATCQTTEDILSPADEDTDQGRHSSTSAELLE